jgi:hypothetical protein
MCRLSSFGARRKLVKASGLESRFLTPHQHATGEVDTESTQEAVFACRIIISGAGGLLIMSRSTGAMTKTATTQIRTSKTMTIWRSLTTTTSAIHARTATRGSGWGLATGLDRSGETIQVMIAVTRRESRKGATSTATGGTAMGMGMRAGEVVDTRRGTTVTTKKNGVGPSQRGGNGGRIMMSQRSVALADGAKGAKAVKGLETHLNLAVGGTDIECGRLDTWRSEAPGNAVEISFNLLQRWSYENVETGAFLKPFFTF